MTNRVLTGIAAAGAAASLLLGAGTVSASTTGPAPAPPSTQLSPAQQPGTPDWTALPVSPNSPALTPQDNTCCVIVPAAPSHATANILEINPLDTCVSCTRADAGNHDAFARARALRLLGQDISAGESHGAHDRGALLAIPANPLLALAIADWLTDTDAGPVSTARSRASLVDLSVLPMEDRDGRPRGAITLAVLEATSRAEHTAPQSKGYGDNNGVRLDIGDGALVVILLHSDASSENNGSAYVLGINGSKLISSDQAGGSGIPIEVPGVVGVILLKVGASGGEGSASVGTASNLLGSSGQAAGVLTASGVGLAGQQAAPITPQAPATGAAAPATGSGLSVPSTGMALGLSGLVVLPSGLALLLVSLRRRRRGLAG
jgi:hypothetical protein